MGFFVIGLHDRVKRRDARTPFPQTFVATIKTPLNVARFAFTVSGSGHAYCDDARRASSRGLIKLTFILGFG